uniref:Uncharacterized protein n=1 Tax=Rhipicephalus zambeziensis TaxID=60191 RepID=A0A224YEI1_9ACAR
MYKISALFQFFEALHSETCKSKNMDAVSERSKYSCCAQQQTVNSFHGIKRQRLQSVFYFCHLSFFSFFTNRQCWHPQSVRWGYSRIFACCQVFDDMKGLHKKVGMPLAFCQGLRERSPSFCDQHFFFSGSAAAKYLLHRGARKGLWATQYPVRSDAVEKQKACQENKRRVVQCVWTRTLFPQEAP